MRRFFTTLLLVLMLIAVKVSATTVTGTVTDPDTTVWVNGGVIFNLNGSGGPPYYCAGTKMTSAQTNVTMTLDSSGAFSGTICDNSTITPVNSQWQITVCSATTAPCQVLKPTTIIGSSQSLTTLINGQIKAIRVPAFFGTRAYTDTEILNPIGGSTYYNLTSSVIRLYNGISWSTLLTGSGSVTQVSNSDGSLTITPITGAVVASVNPAHVNTWTALQIFSNDIQVGFGTFHYDNGTATMQLNSGLKAPGSTFTIEVHPLSTITPGATPSIGQSALQTIILSADSTPTLPSIISGEHIVLRICQPATGGPFHWTPPTAMHGAISDATIFAMAANNCAVQAFDSYGSTTVLVAENTGVTNVIP